MCLQNLFRLRPNKIVVFLVAMVCAMLRLEGDEVKMFSSLEVLKSSSAHHSPSYFNYYQHVEEETKSTNTAENDEHCALWNVTQDDWWQEHPDWRLSRENDTHTCFQRVRDPEIAEYFRNIYNVQFGAASNCSNLHEQFIIGTGFAAAVRQLTLSFYYANLGLKKTFVRSKHWRNFKWMYNHPYNETLQKMGLQEARFGSCASMDVFCYYLPIARCNEDYQGVSNMIPKKLAYVEGDFGLKPKTLYRHHVSYFMRLNQVSRKKLFDIYQQSVVVPDGEDSLSPRDCVALHVRRTDAMTERGNLRSFHAIQEYLDLVPNLTATTPLVLLTDDQSAIDEAHLLHPEYRWYYINRTRYFGAQKKNQHFPSGDPALEFLYIHADLRLARFCHTLVHGKSNMVHFIQHSMLEGNSNRDDVEPLFFFITESNMTPGTVFIADLKNKLEAARQNQSDN